MFSLLFFTDVRIVSLQWSLMTSIILLLLLLCRIENLEVYQFVDPEYDVYVR